MVEGLYNKKIIKNNIHKQLYIIWKNNVTGDGFSFA